MIESGTRSELYDSDKYMQLPDTPNLGRVSQRVEEIKGDLDYCEWISGKIVSRYFDHGRVKVNLLGSVAGNQKSYLSVTQLDALARIPQEKILFHYKDNLAEGHFALINRYRSIYHPQVLFVKSPQKEPVMVIQNEQVKKEELIIAFRNFFSEKREVLKESLSSKDRDFRIRAVALLGALSLSATSFTLLQPENQQGDSERFATGEDSLSRIEHSLVLPDEAMPQADSWLHDTEVASLSLKFPIFPETQDISSENGGLGVTEETVLQQAGGATIANIESPIPVLASAVSSAIETGTNPSSASLNEIVNLVYVPNEIVPAVLDVFPTEATEFAPKENEAVVPENMPEQFISTLSELVPTVNSSAVNEQRRTQSVSIAVKEQKTATPTTTEVPQQPVVLEKRNYSLTAKQIGWLQATKIAGSDWSYVDYIITKESYWRPFIWNQQGSGAYGLCQRMMPVHKLKAGEKYMEDPVAQLVWCNNYAQKRYGSWERAYYAWLRQNWW